MGFPAKPGCSHIRRRISRDMSLKKVWIKRWKLGLREQEEMGQLSHSRRHSTSMSVSFGYGV